MNQVYPITISAFGVGDLDWVADTFKARLLDADYTFSAAHDFLADVPAGARLGSPVALSGKTTTAGSFHASDLTFTSVAAGGTVRALLVYRDTGVEATSQLVTYTDTRADTVPISVPTNGGDILWRWPIASGRVFKL